MTSSRLVIQAIKALTATTLLSTLVLIAPPPVAAQTDCASRDQCDQLRDRLQENRREVHELRREMRQLRRDLQALPADGPERERIREQVRESRHEVRSLIRESRPLRQDVRQHCRGCFAGKPPSGSQ